MDITKYLILIAVGMATVLAIIMYLNYIKKTSVTSIKNHVPEPPIVVDENYLIAQSGLTKEKYYERIELYKKRRLENWMKSKKDDKKNPKKERSIDDELGMSF